jgi:CubicO group peptidase (beta-lactamase class C family)
MRFTRSTPLVLTFLLAIGAASAPAAAQPRPAAPPPSGGKPGAALAGPTMTVAADKLERAKTYNFKPAHIASAADREEVAQLNGPAAIALRKIAVKPQQAKPKLNVTKMGEDMHAALKDNVRGYAFQVRKGGTPLYTLIWEWSRSPNQGSKGWTLDTRMHVASVSKLLTAIGVTRMLDERNLPFDTKIGPYLPSHWSVGPNAADITFKELLTHRAGFNEAHHGGDYATFKDQIADGVPANAGYVYSNGGFSINRVLGSVMTGVIAKNTSFPGLPPAQRDAIWDIVTQDGFQNYMNAKVFAPSGVSGITSTGSANSALAYSTKGDGNGWDSGDLDTQVGGAGFRVSVNDVLNVMGTFRRKGTIVPVAKAQASLDASLGIDRIDDTPAGKMYLKNGWWGGGGKDGGNWHVEQAVAAYLPDDMEAVVLVNSNIGPNGASLTQTFRNAVLNNIE